MASLSSLRNLSKFWSVIFGKAQSYEISLRALEPSSGRPDFIDDQTEGMRSALDALRNLKTLFENNERAAKVIMIIYILWGEQARLLKDNWVDLGRMLKTLHPEKKISATLRHQLYCEAMNEHVRATKLWEKL